MCWEDAFVWANVISVCRLFVSRVMDGGDLFRTLPLSSPSMKSSPTHNRNNWVWGRNTSYLLSRAQSTWIIMIYSLFFSHPLERRAHPCPLDTCPKSATFACYQTYLCTFSQDTSCLYAFVERITMRNVQDRWQTYGFRWNLGRVAPILIVILFLFVFVKFSAKKHDTNSCDLQSSLSNVLPLK